MSLKTFKCLVSRIPGYHGLLDSEQELIRPNQHGFVSGRSTQSQLLQHYSDVYDALEEGVRIDTIYLDFAKAFDKVDQCTSKEGD